MKLRHFKRRRDAMRRRMRWLKAYWAYEAEVMGGPDPWPDDDWDEDESLCTRCGGSGYMDAEDPINDDCDEYGQADCRYCHGTGERQHQTIF